MSTATFSPSMELKGEEGMMGEPPALACLFPSLLLIHLHLPLRKVIRGSRTAVSGTAMHRKQTTM